METHPTALLERSPSRFCGQRIHFIGIGGSGMSGLARMLLDDGAIISGSEPTPNQVTGELCKRGVRISRDQLGELLDREVKLAVRTAAVRDGNPEYSAALRYGIRTIKYAQLLGEVMAERLGVAVGGTHGKSTTTAMTAWALLRCGLDPSFVVGGTVPQLGGGSRSGRGRPFVAEACEYDRSFHNLHPRVALITNIEAEHLDCYKDLGEIIESFAHFANLAPADGLVIANGQDANVAAALRHVRAPRQTVGIGTGFDWSMVPTEIIDGRRCGRLMHQGREVGRVHLSVAGEHNLFNAAMATAAATACGADPAAALEAVGTFRGVDRRMSEMGRCNGAVVLDDYGHHPTEVRTTLRAIRERYQPQRLICVFQPHQHSRTRSLMDQFASSFEQADETILPEIYSVRDSESERRSVCSADLVERIIANGQRARHVSDFAGVVAHLRSILRPGDVVVTMGAGNVWEIARELAG